MSRSTRKSASTPTLTFGDLSLRSPAYYTSKRLTKSFGFEPSESGTPISTTTAEPGNDSLDSYSNQTQSCESYWDSDVGTNNSIGRTRGMSSGPELLHPKTCRPSLGTEHKPSRTFRSHTQQFPLAFCDTLTEEGNLINPKDRSTPCSISTRNSIRLDDRVCCGKRAQSRYEDDYIEHLEHSSNCTEDCPCCQSDGRNTSDLPLTARSGTTSPTPALLSPGWPCAEVPAPAARNATQIIPDLQDGGFSPCPKRPRSSGAFAATRKRSIPLASGLETCQEELNRESESIFGQSCSFKSSTSEYQGKSTDECIQENEFLCNIPSDDMALQELPCKNKAQAVESDVTEKQNIEGHDVPAMDSSQRTHTMESITDLNCTDKPLKSALPILPSTACRTPEWKSISSDVMKKLLAGEFDESMEGKHFEVYDCRYNYEFDGGHIQGAKHLNDPDELHKLFEKYPNGTADHIFIFHCEFSQKRAPTMMRLLRTIDRQRNPYPKLSFPHLYLLDRGYKAFYEKYPSFCTPMSYTRMEDKSCKTSSLPCKQIRQKLIKQFKWNYIPSSRQYVDRKFSLSCPSLPDMLSGTSGTCGTPPQISRRVPCVSTTSTPIPMMRSHSCSGTPSSANSVKRTNDDETSRRKETDDYVFNARRSLSYIS